MTSASSLLLSQVLHLLESAELNQLPYIPLKTNEELFRISGLKNNKDIVISPIFLSILKLNGIYINIKMVDRQLQTAIDMGYCCIVKEALRNGANILPSWGASNLGVLHWTFTNICDPSKDPHKIVRVILKEAQRQGVLSKVVNWKCSEGSTAICHAISNNHNKSIKLLLDTGVCDLTVTDENGDTVIETLGNLGWKI